MYEFVSVRVCMCVCVCVRERERARAQHWLPRFLGTHESQPTSELVSSCPPPLCLTFSPLGPNLRAKGGDQIEPALSGVRVGYVL